VTELKERSDFNERKMHKVTSDEFHLSEEVGMLQDRMRDLEEIVKTSRDQQIALEKRLLRRLQL